MTWGEILVGELLTNKTCSDDLPSPWNT